MSDLEIIRDMIARAQARGDMKDPSGPEHKQQPARVEWHNAHGDGVDIYAGYTCFYAAIEFNTDGSLKAISAWE